MPRGSSLKREREYEQLKEQFEHDSLSYPRLRAIVRRLYH